MTPTERAIERAIIEAAHRVLTRRAAALRDRAGRSTSSIEHEGRAITIVSPEATVALGTAALFEECAAEIKAVSHA